MNNATIHGPIGSVGVISHTFIWVNENQGFTYVLDESPNFKGPKFSVMFTDFILLNKQRFFQMPPINEHDQTNNYVNNLPTTRWRILLTIDSIEIKDRV